MNRYLRLISFVIVRARRNVWYAIIVACLAGLTTGSVAGDISRGDFNVFTVLNMVCMLVYVPPAAALIFTNIGRDS